MCGITGMMSYRDSDLSRIVSRMVEMIRYRGPDNSGVWCDPSIGLALGHARLSILDLSPAAHQPMESASGRYVIAFNGEIYNHVELRRQLTDLSWRGHSDTETLLAAFESWGVEKTLQATVGMFALALWDRVERRLVLARDRMGEKPLYYGWSNGTFLFASELKALEVYPDWRGEVDRGALALFMRYAYVPLPYSIYVGIRKLLPGTYVTISSESPARYLPEPISYWSAAAVAGRAPRCHWTDSAAADELNRLLSGAVKGQMVADVPLGALLSGGIDSSTVVALMQAHSSRPVKTFSIGFREDDYNEAPGAKAVAEHLGTDHTEFYVSPTDALAVIPHLPSMYDEPFGDSSAIPTHLVASLAKKQVTVALSGDGGDELFGGYNRYSWGRSIWRRMARVPVPMRAMAASALTLLSPEQWDRFGKLLRPGLPASLKISTLGEKVHKLAAILDSNSQTELYQRLVSLQRETASLVIGAQDRPIWADAQARQSGDRDFSEAMMLHDLVGFLTDDILTKVDRAAMAISLETRMPLLDHRVVEFSWSLPLSMKIRAGSQGKWLLRQVLYRYVPKHLVERPKMGFGIPLDSWLRGSLRDWVEASLEESRLKREGYFDPAPIRAKWREHLSGRRNWQYWLWNVLMFQAWLGAHARSASPAVSHH
ncbi:asparagine synthase (glutamine-hydrolyzing) [Nitrospira sp. BLG_2]|uniref:asparagine synthase (glutamine-hydrolyzing) n=1 Tax=Nitrospira sp. BLG_2 TaxID=3397507 RepID=UPI003B9D3148